MNKLYGVQPIKKVYKIIQAFINMKKFQESYYGNYKGIYSNEIIRAMYPERLYPKWEKLEIKRKYGKYPAIYLDVYQPYLKSIFELMPKTKWTKQEWRIKGV